MGLEEDARRLRAEGQSRAAKQSQDQERNRAACDDWLRVVRAAALEFADVATKERLPFDQTTRRLWSTQRFWLLTVPSTWVEGAEGYLGNACIAVDRSGSAFLTTEPTSIYNRNGPNTRVWSGVGPLKSSDLPYRYAHAGEVRSAFARRLARRSHG